MSAQGTCKWFDAKKGFGFITIEGADAEDVFVHQTEIKQDGFRKLRNGARVTLSRGIDDDGRTYAKDVHVI